MISGEGGALLINDPALAVTAEIFREKGTDRSRFFRSELDKYTWREVGSSFLPGELIAAFLWARLQEAEAITAGRITAWKRYHEALAPLEAAGHLRRPVVPADCTHKAHLSNVLLSAEHDRAEVLQRLKEAGINAVFHYVPLHLSQAGQRFGKTQGRLERTEALHARLIRLPLWNTIGPSQQSRGVDTLSRILAG